MNIDALGFALSCLGGALFFATEWLWPAGEHRPFHDLVKNSAAALMTICLGSVTIAALAVASSRFASPLAGIESQPTWLRIAAFVLAADAARYAVHRLMHRPGWWRVHRFHHSIEFVNWFTGLRASPVHIVLFSAPLPLLAWLLQVDPVAQAMNLTVMTLSNHLMHTNTRIPEGLQRRVEWVLVTPRYHRPHHSTDPSCRDTNFAAMFSFWDRLFGTYFDPDRMRSTSLRFGLGEPRPAKWLPTALGL
jgi:sterol desaturase/sphingolipid hydroxylase (fatty acid hydroxylase superfamily)